MKIEAAIFDIGNVLVRFDWIPAEREIRLRTRRSTEKARSEMVELKERFELGQLSERDFLENAVRILDFRGGTDELAAIWNSIFSENEAMEKSIAQLKRSMPLYLLSNTSELHLSYLEKRFRVLEHFTDGVYSFRAGCAKPFPQIFDVAERQFGVNRSTTIFVDDLSQNVDSAAGYGFQAIRYDWNAHSEFQETLVKFGLFR